jgi:hypothetical protein
VDGKGRNKSRVQPTGLRCAMRRAITLSFLYVASLGILIAAYGFVPAA